MKFGKIQIDGYQLPSTDGTSGYVMQTNGAGSVSWAEGGGTGGGTMTRDITQSGHGLSVGNVVRFDGANYVKAQADTGAHAEVAGIVSAVGGLNDFTILLGGYITGLSGLTAGSVHFLSETSSGALTTTEPSSPYISKPILIATSTTAGYFYNMRGADQSGGSGGFGAWDASKTYDTVYQADTDGFAMLYWTGVATPAAGTIDAYTDSTNPPTTIRQSMYYNWNIGPYAGHVCIPVRKNDYWKIVRSGNPTNLTIGGVFWIPDYSGGTSSSSSGTTGYGNYETKANNTVYQAGSDGIVVCDHTDSVSGSMDGYTDASNPPTTQIMNFGWNQGTGSTHHTGTMPVKKGNYWKVTGANNVYWIPDYGGDSSSISGSYGVDRNVIIVANSGTPNTQVDVNFDALNIDGYYALNGDYTIDCSTTGANALDTGSLAADTWYYVYAIYNPTTATVAALMSTSSTAPTMPSGYTKRRLIGYRKTNSGGATIDKAFQWMDIFRHDVPVQVTTTVSSGAWSSAVSCNTTGKRGIPPGVRAAHFGIALYASGSRGDPYVWIRPNGSTWSTNDAYGIVASASSALTHFQVAAQRFCLTDDNQQIQHYENGVNPSTLEIGVEGFYCGLFSGGGSSSSTGSGAEDIIARGFELVYNSTTSVDINPGVLYHGSTKVSKTAATTLSLSSASDWYDGAAHSYSGGAGWCYIGVNSSGGVKLLHTNAPDKADTNGNTAGTKYYWLYSTGSVYYRVIGAVRVETTDTITKKFYQKGNFVKYDVATNQQVLSGGSAGGCTTAVNCSGYVPVGIATSADIYGQPWGAQTDYIGINGSSAWFSLDGPGNYWQVWGIPLNGNNIYYGTNGTVSLYVIGFYLDIRG